MQDFWIGGIGLALGLVLLVLGLKKRKKWLAETAALVDKYGSADADSWTTELQDYTDALADYEVQMGEYRKAVGELGIRREKLRTQKEALCGEQLPEKVAESWQQMLRQWEQRDLAHRELLRTENFLHSMQAMAKPAKAPQMADDLT